MLMNVSTGSSSPSEQAGELHQETVTEERPATTTSTTAAAKPEAAEAMEVDQTHDGTPTDKTVTSTTDNPGPTSSSAAVSHDPEPEEAEAEWVEHLRVVDNILSGEKTVTLHQEFLIRNNHTDLQILKNTKVCKLIDY